MFCFVDAEMIVLESLCQRRTLRSSFCALNAKLADENVPLQVFLIYPIQHYIGLYDLKISKSIFISSLYILPSYFAIVHILLDTHHTSCTVCIS